MVQEDALLEREKWYDSSMTDRTTERLKHLEFLQANITRMHEASTSMKRLAILAFALGGSLARYLQDVTTIGLTVAVIAAIWALDSKYLQVERAYRALYNQVRALPYTEPTSFDLTPPISKALPLSELCSWSTVVLYGPLIILLTAIWLCADWTP